jgi:membrane protease subunit HflK
MHWWVAAMAIFYVLSGTTVVKSDEVAVILRWGRLVGDTPALQEHGPGLLFALPRPVDRVVRVPVKHVGELTISTLAASTGAADSEYASDTLDPLRQGYAVTGDHNIVHVIMVARYRVKDAAEWALYGPPSENVLRVEVSAAMVRSLGEIGVDRVLADGRKDLIAGATRRAQAGLDLAHSGLEISSLELVGLAPPRSLTSDFDAVQSAFIQAETQRKDAQTYAETVVPEAQARAQAATESARGAAASSLALARGEGDAFRSLDREYRASAPVVRERLYRDAVERAIGGAGTVRWVPPPVGGKYNGLRITLGPSAAGRPQTGNRSPVVTEDDDQ